MIVGANLASPTSQAEKSKVFYVVVSEWTFGLYDENFNKLENITVNKGDQVTLVLITKPFTPPELHEELEQDFLKIAKEKGLFETEDDLEKAHEETFQQLGKMVYGVEYIPHGFAIKGYEDKVNVELEDGNIVVVTFTADKQGVFDIYCSEFCGVPHSLMNIEGGFIVQ